MSTIHVGVFTASRDRHRLPVGVHSEGDSFLSWGAPPRAGDPIHLTVSTRDLGGISPDTIRRGYEMLDAVLGDGERLTDYAVVTDDDGEVVTVITILDQEVYDVSEPDFDPGFDRAVEPPVARPRRWSPFR